MVARPRQKAIFTLHPGMFDATALFTLGGSGNAAAGVGSSRTARLEPVEYRHHFTRGGGAIIELALAGQRDRLAGRRRLRGER